MHLGKEGFSFVQRFTIYGSRRTSRPVGKIAPNVLWFRQRDSTDPRPLRINVNDTLAGARLSVRMTRISSISIPTRKTMLPEIGAP